MALHLEDRYDNTLVVDDKHCADDELRLVVCGSEFYLTAESAWWLTQELVDKLKRGI